ncbi:hypothetical protein K466DRAFT_586284 [Polyporus arcularius HHB13444]|uniref:Uncharacterized protein n=1 Tax=Polyporus arcularius HHB13444 TaxID=1314778 RepID=A0A5C3PG06_9APHY|nr:hypothetical protein K466DRAFT_586284 [Polyporus arcularius HHB13444]
MYILTTGLLLLYLLYHIRVRFLPRCHLALLSPITASSPATQELVHTCVRMLYLVLAEVALLLYAVRCSVPAHHASCFSDSSLDQDRAVRQQPHSP